MLSTVIVGGGPGGLGPLIAAAQLGHLPGWLERGVAIVDRLQTLGGTLGRYAINSDTLGGAYLECLESARAPAEMRELLSHPLSQQIEAYRFGFPPLAFVHRYMQLLGGRIEAMLAATAQSAFHSGTDARSIHLRPGGTLRVEAVGPDGAPRSIESQTAVVALGGLPNSGSHHLKSGMMLSGCKLHDVMTSDELMTEDGIGRVARILRAHRGRPIVILGGSHSGYSSASALIDLLPRSAVAGMKIMLLQRRAPPVFYPSAAAAEADGYPVTSGDICSRTLRVNRLGGLRGDGREMWRRIHGCPGVRRERRVECSLLASYRTPELRALLEGAALVVTAFGYRAASLPIFDEEGRRLPLSAERGDAAVSDSCRILLQDGRPLRNVFGLGLGSGYKPTESMGGEPNFRGQANSLWLYQNDIGAMIYHGVQTVLHEQRQAAVPYPPVDGGMPSAAALPLQARR